MNRSTDRIIDFRYAPDVIQTCIGLVDDPFKSIVREDGSLNYNYRANSWGLDDAVIPGQDQIPQIVRPANKSLRFLHRLKPAFTHKDKLLGASQYYGDPALPFVTTVEKYANSRLEWTVFAYTDGKGLRADIVHWNLSVTEDFGYAPSRVELQLAGAYEELPSIIQSPGTTGYWTEDGFNLDGITHFQFLKGGEKREGVFAIVFAGELDPADVTCEWAMRARDQMRDYWSNIKLFENNFCIPEPQIMGMLQACARNLLQAREVKNGLAEYQVGPTVYRGLWVIDGHFMLEAVHMMGKRQEAYQGVDAVLRRVAEDGSIQILPDHTKETGIALATFVRQCELMNDDQRLLSLWPVMCRALDHIYVQRQKAIELGGDYPGIFPPAFMDGGIAGPFADYSTPLWILIGLKSAAEAGERLDLEGCHRFRSLYEELYQLLLSCIERDRREESEGNRYFPMNMEERDYDRPQSATWSLAHAITPGELFAPEDQVTSDFLTLLDSIDNEQGIPKETGWIHDQALWGYSSMFYAQAWLYAGRADKAADYLYAFANHAAPSRVWREEQSLKASHAAEYCGDMPHNWGSAEFIRLVRHMLVLEKQGGLEIFAGLPTDWLPGEASGPLELVNTATAYGEVSVSLSYAGEGSFNASLSVREGCKKPKHVIIHWPGSAPTVNGQCLQAEGDGWLLPDSSSETWLLLADFR